MTDKKIITNIDHVHVEVLDQNTGEITTVKPDLVQVVSERKFHTTFTNPVCKDGEVNSGEYIVDDTGHFDLETLYKRSISQGVIPFRPYESEYDADTPLENLDPVIPPEGALEPSNSSSASSSEVPSGVNEPSSTTVEPVVSPDATQTV